MSAILHTLNAREERLKVLTTTTDSYPVRTLQIQNMISVVITLHLSYPFFIKKCYTEEFQGFCKPQSL